MVTYLVTEEQEIYLLTIYDKSEIENIDDKMLRDMVKEIDV